MSVQVRRRREAAAFLSTFVGAQGELLVDTTNNRVQVHDGASPGGWPVAKLAETATITAGGANGNITTLGALVSINGGPLAGFRNRIRNGNFAINQRAVSGTVTLVAGAYGQDGVKAGASGATYTFATSGIDTVLTITAGSIILPIEAGMIEGGVYTLSQTGGAQARVWQGTGTSGSGSYAAVPFQSASLSAATQTNVEFSTGTVSRVQFETGAVATAFERRPSTIELVLCQRYYFAASFPSPLFSYPFQANAFYCVIAVPLPVTMRAAPTVTMNVTSSITFASGYPTSQSYPSLVVIRGDATAANNYAYLTAVTASAEL